MICETCSVEFVNRSRNKAARRYCGPRCRNNSKVSRGHQGKYKKARYRLRKAMTDKLKSVPCADCGGTFDPICMDFDHKPGVEKRDDVSGIICGRSDANVAAEIAKCEVVCANCHRLRTKRRKEEELNGND